MKWEWYQDSETVHLFVHLLLEANHKPQKWRGMTIKRGQVVTGLGALNNALGLSVRSIRTRLARLERSGALERVATNKFSVITIPKYSKYQDALKRATSKRQTGDAKSENDRQTKAPGKRRRIDTKKPESKKGRQTGDAEFKKDRQQTTSKKKIRASKHAHARVTIGEAEKMLRLELTKLEAVAVLKNIPAGRAPKEHFEAVDVQVRSFRYQNRQKKRKRLQQLGKKWLKAAIRSDPPYEDRRRENLADDPEANMTADELGIVDRLEYENIDVREARRIVKGIDRERILTAINKGLSAASLRLEITKEKEC